VKAALATGPGQVEVAEVPDPVPGDGQSVVRVTRAGICGTDLKVLDGKVPSLRPVILGHELTGKVEAPAPGSAFTPGARVVIDPSSYCGGCEVCRRDRPHLCPNGGLMGRDSHGGFAELVAVPDHRLHPLPDEVGDDDAVLVQMLTTCVHGQALLHPELGQSGLVIGLGATGLLHVQLLAARGVAPVIGVSRSQAKRTLAAELGATVTATPEDALGVVADATGGRGAEIAIECAGDRDALIQAMAATGLGGTVLIFGTIAPTAEGVALPTYDWYLKELRLLNTRAARPRDFTASIRVIGDGLVRPSSLITSSYPLPEAGAALAAAARPEEIKVTIDV
jgi:L-iditol 2-dehydrogenase